MNIVKPYLRESVYQVFSSIRDLCLPILPSRVVTGLMGRCDFVFLAHPLDLEDLARKYPFARGLSRNGLKIISRYLWPVIGSRVVGFRDRSGNPITGWVIFCPLTTRMLVLQKSLARRRISQCARLACKLGVRVIGLGAYIPILTEKGVLVAEDVPMAVTAGSTFSAVIAVQNVLKATNFKRVDTKSALVAIVGAAGAVGSLCSRLLVGHFGRFLLVDKNLAGAEGLKRELILQTNGQGADISVQNTLRGVDKADVVVVTTNTPGAILRSEHLKLEAIVIDAAQPRNVSAKVVLSRHDVIVVGSGVAEVPNLNTNFNFVGLSKSNQVYSCMAEELLMLWEGDCSPGLRIPSENYARKLMSLAAECGVNPVSVGFDAGLSVNEDRGKCSDSATTARVR